MKITRKDIAEMAGVSTATVSYVINGSNRVSEETRKRILQIIDEYDYKPDLIARAMSTHQTMQIALLVNDLHNNFFAEIVTEFEKAAIKEGYCVNICTSEQNISHYIDSFVTRRMDGVFSMVSPTRINLQQLYSLRQYDIPVLMSGNTKVDTSIISSIEPNYEQGIYIGLNYLKNAGHRKIAYLSAFSPNFECDSRLEMFIKLYDQMFLKDEKTVVMGTYPFSSTIDTGFELTERLIAEGASFTAVLATNDSMAIGCIEALKKHGYRVPEDVSVMGFDNIPIGKHVAVPLTTIGFDKYRFANDAFTMLYNSIKTGEVYDKKEDMYITERKSVSICPKQKLD